MHIKDTVYFQFKEANIKAFKLEREIKMIIKPFFIAIIEWLNNKMFVK